MKLRLLAIQVNDAASRRAPGYLEAFKAVSQTLPTHVEIEREDLERLNREWPIIQSRKIGADEALPAAPHSLAPVVKTKWPLTPFGIAARTLKLLKSPEDSGVGDTIARTVGPVGGDNYKKWFKDTFGRTCGCTERQDQLNEQFPYEKTNP